MARLIASVPIPDRSLHVISWGGAAAQITLHDDPVWTVQSGYTVWAADAYSAGTALGRAELEGRPFSISLPADGRLLEFRGDGDAVAVLSGGLRCWTMTTLQARQLGEALIEAAAHAGYTEPARAAA